MVSSFINSIVFDILNCTFIDDFGGEKKLRANLKRHINRAKKVNRNSQQIDALESILLIPFNQSKEYAYHAINTLLKDNDLINSYIDIYELWSALINEDYESLKKWQRPWIIDAGYAEKFKGGKRSVYQGQKNQLTAAISIAKEKNYNSGILITESKVNDFLSRENPNKYKKEDFPPLCYFSAPIENEAGGTSSPNFFSIPIWAIEPFRGFFTHREQTLYEKMIERRENELKPFKPANKSVLALVKKKVNWQQRSHKITVNYHKASAHYDPSNDFIAMPKISQFNSELDYYSTWTHELAHSTDKFLKRTKRHQSKTHKEQYAIEEIIAETTAFLAIKRLESEARDMGILNQNVQEIFDNSFDMSKSYTTSWGKRIKNAFGELKDTKYRNSLMSSMIKDILLCHLTISTGTYFGEEIKR